MIITHAIIIINYFNICFKLEHLRIQTTVILIHIHNSIKLNKIKNSRQICIDYYKCIIKSYMHTSVYNNIVVIPQILKYDIMHELSRTFNANTSP